MARQLLVGADVTAATATGIILHKKDANGEPVIMVAGDDLGSAPEIQFCQNGGECSPWIKGTDLVSWSGTSGVAQTAQTVLVTSLAPTAAGNTVTLKLIDKASGSEPYVRENIEFLTGASANATSTLMNTAIAAHIAVPGYKGMIATTAVAAPVVTITSHTYAGPAAAGYNAQSNIEVAFDPGTDAAAGVTVAGAAATSTMGDLFVLADFEKDLVGERSGDYYRIQQPNASAYYVNGALGKPYDVYCLEWQSRYTRGQINKVDNTHSLYIAVPSAPAVWLQTAGATALQVILNGAGGYLFHTPVGTSTVVL
jgi:hypothetical protein